MESWTNDFIRVPFKERGRARAGADCWGIAVLIYRERLGIELPILDGYENIKDRKKMCEIIEQETSCWKAIPKGEEKEYDIAVFSMVGLPMHVGVVIRPGDMIHSQKGSGASIDNYIRDQAWSKRFEGFYRYAEGTD